MEYKPCEKANENRATMYVIGATMIGVIGAGMIFPRSLAVSPEQLQPEIILVCLPTQ